MFKAILQDLLNGFISIKYKKLIKETKHDIQYGSIDDAVYSYAEFIQIVNYKTEIAKELDKLVNKRLAI